MRAIWLARILVAHRKRTGRYDGLSMGQANEIVAACSMSGWRMTSERAGYGWSAPVCWAVG
jgi:hypothetical protein